MALSATQLNALRTIEHSTVHVSNKGQTSVKGLAAQTFASLRKAKLVDLNGASRTVLANGRSARRAVLTKAGKMTVEANAA